MRARCPLRTCVSSCRAPPGSGLGRRLQDTRRGGGRVDVLARYSALGGKGEDVNAVPFQLATVVGVDGTRGPLTRREVIAAAQGPALETECRPAREDRGDVGAYRYRARDALCGRVVVEDDRVVMHGRDRV